MVHDVESEVTARCLALPGVEQRTSHGAPAFFAGRQSLHLWPDGHHDRPGPHLWCAAPAGAQEAAIAEDPMRFFRPPYVGNRGWLGVVLDGDIDWDDVGACIVDAWRCVAPARLVRATEATGG